MAKLTKLNSLSLFFPCFNEAKNIEKMVESLTNTANQVAKKYEIIIINDGSHDQTGKIAEKLAQKKHFLRVIHHPKNRGYGASIQSGINASKYQWLFYTDGDCQFDTSQLKMFIPHTQSFQVIIGYRKKRADGPIRQFNASMFKLFVDTVFRVGVKDIDCAFKLFNSKLVKSLPLQSTGAMISAELLYRLKKQNIKFKQLPVNHYPRLHGQPSGNNLKVILKAGQEALNLYLHLKFGVKS